MAKSQLDSVTRDDDSVIARQTQSRRRRGLARARRPRNEFDSDEELEREPASDAESLGSSSHSYGESGSESDAEDVTAETTNGVDGHDAPSSSVVEASLVEESYSNSKKASPEPTTLFSQPLDWAEVAYSEAHDLNGVPVLDFSEFGPSKADPASRSATDQLHEKSPTAQSSMHEESANSKAESKIHIPARLSTRQAYQRRLNEDPSYVPVVGEFWGHDDRLMDKSLRSLSTWWRGRWVGQGRGRGARGIRRDHTSPGHLSKEPQIFGQQKSQRNLEVDRNLMRPSEKTWSHDGYEEMKSREEARVKGRLRLREQKRAIRGGFPLLHSRAAALPPSRSGTPTEATFANAYARPWYLKKPERTWTKQFDAFLFNDYDLKQRHSHERLIRIRLPGLPSSMTTMHHTSSVSDIPPLDSSVDELLDFVVVNLPKRQLETAISLRSHPPESATTMEPPPVEVSIQTPSSVLDHPFRTANRLGFGSAPQPSASIAQDVDVLTTTTYSSSTQLQTSKDIDVSALENNDAATIQPPSSYGSTYTYPAHAPPNILYGNGRYPIDASTGGPLYMAHDMSHVPPPMYNPTLPMPSHVLPTGLVTYGHMQPDYVSLPGFTEGQGMQFSLPRQNSRIEIRAPEDNSHYVSTSSTLRSRAEPFRPASTLHYYNSTDSGPREQEGLLPQPMLYQGVQYYLPPYTYGGYVDPDRQYEAYPQSDAQPVFY